MCKFSSKSGGTVSNFIFWGDLTRNDPIVSIGHASCTLSNKRVGRYLTKKHTVFRVIIKVTEKVVIIR